MAGVKFDITGNANGFVGAARQAENAARNMSRSVTNEGKALDDMFKKLAGGMATLAAGFTATELTKKIFNIRSEFQQLEVAFTTMLKSKEKADKLMMDAAEFAATTPFDLKQVAAGIRSNLAYGASAETVIDEMRMLGDVAAGLSMPLNDLVYLYGTLRTSGRVATIDIRQFAGRGIPIYEELAKVLGVAKDEVAGLVTAGKVGFADVEQAFKNMTSAGGMFHNLMADQSKTLQGQYSNLKDNIEMMFNEIGQSTQGVFADTLSLAGKLVENYETVGRALSVLVATYGTYKAAVIAVAAVEKAQIAVGTIQKFLELTRVMKVATAAQQAFNGAALANPYVLAASALAALISGVVAFTKHKKAEVEAQKEASREVAKEVNEVNVLATKLKDANTAEDERVAALNRLKEIAPEVVEGIDSEKSSLEQLNTQLEEYNTLKSVEIALKASTEYIDFSESIQSVKDAKAEMQKQQAEMLNLWTDLSTKITTAIENGEVSDRMAKWLKGFMYDPAIDMNEKLSKVLAKYDDMMFSRRMNYDYEKGDFGFLQSIAREAGGATGFYEEASKDLVSAETAYTDAVESLRERIHDTIAQVITDADEAKKAEDTLLKSLGLIGETPSGAGGGTDEQKKQTAKQQENAYKRKQAQIKSAEELAKLTKSLNDKVAKADIDSMEDGYTKSLKTLKFNLQQELDAIEQQKKDLLKRKKDDALKSWLAEDPEGRKEYQFVYNPKLTPEEEEIFRKMGQQAQAEFNEGRKDLNKQWSKEAEFTTRQFSIDAMSDGASKEAAQRQLDNDRELHNLELQREAYIEAAKAAHILAEQKRMAADPTYMMQMFNESQANANFDKIVADTTDRQRETDAEREANAWNEYLIAYGNYEEKKKAIMEKYENLIAKAGTVGEVATYEKQQEQELFDLEVAYGKTANTIASLFGDMRKKSADDLNTIADEGEKALNFIKSGQYSSDNAFGITQEQFDMIRNSPEELAKIAAAILGIREQADALEGPIDKIGEGFKELFASKKGTQEFEKALSKITDGVGEITNAIGFVSDSLGSMGEALGNDGLTKASEGINSALNVVGQTMSGAQAGAAFDPWGAAAGAAIGLVTSLVTEISKAKDAIRQARIDELAEQNVELDKSYEDLAENIEKAYSVDASKLIEQQNTLLEQKKANLRLMIAEEKAKKNANEEQIKEWENEINGIETSIEDNAEKAKEAVNGISFDGFRDNFLDALLDMEEGAEGLADTIEEDIRKAMYDALLSDDAFEQRMRSLYDDLAAAIEAGDTREIDRIKDAILNLYDSQEQKAREIDEKLGYEADSTREASEKGVAQASQSSVDEMNGRMTAVQSHTFSINERVGSLLNVASQMLARVISIEGYTARLAEIDQTLYYMRSDISDILTKGIKIKA